MEARDLPDEFVHRLEQANTPDRVSVVLDRLSEDDLIRGIEPAALARLFSRAGQDEEAARLENDLAQEALEGRDVDLAMKYLKQAVSRHARLLGQGENDRLFVSESLQLSDLCIDKGMDLEEILSLLQKVRTVAERLQSSGGAVMLNLSSISRSIRMPVSELILAR